MEDYRVLINYDGKEYKSNLSKLADKKFCRIMADSLYQKNTIEFECDEGDLEFRRGELKFISGFEQNDLILTFNSIEDKLENRRTLFKILCFFMPFLLYIFLSLLIYVLFLIYKYIKGGVSK